MLIMPICVKHQEICYYHYLAGLKCARTESLHSFSSLSSSFQALYDNPKVLFHKEKKIGSQDTK